MYLFQSITFFFQNHSSDLLIEQLSSLMWSNKHTIISKQFLQRHKEQKGIALPNLMYYYWAATYKQ